MSTCSIKMQIYKNMCIILCLVLVELVCKENHGNLDSNSLKELVSDSTIH